MSLDHQLLEIGEWGFPRVSGDEPTSAHYVASAGRFSPREWG